MSESKYKPEYCDRVVEMMKDGSSFVEVASEIGISERTIHAWRKRHEDFSKACELAMTHCEAWWVKAGKEALNNKDFNGRVWYFNMKNRFGWRDMREHQVSGNIEIGVKKVVLVDDSTSGSIEEHSGARVQAEGGSGKSLPMSRSGDSSGRPSRNGEKSGNG